MIRAVVLFGWLGLVVYVAAGVVGYGATIETDQVSGHLLVSLLASSALLLVYLCVLIYVNGTARLVVTTVGSSSLGDEWLGPYERLRTRANLWLAAGAGLIVLSFASGVLVYIGHADSAPHHVAFYVGLPVHGAALVALGGCLKRGEQHLSSLDRHLHHPDSPKTT